MFIKISGTLVAQKKNSSPDGLETITITVYRTEYAFGDAEDVTKKPVSS